MHQPFIKMDGAGNDFVVFDARKKALPLTSTQAKHIADRDKGIGCDQVIVIEPSADADAFMRIYNSDGGEVESCGNAVRCVAWLLMQESGKRAVDVTSKGGAMHCDAAGEKQVRVDMGPPHLGWQEIPLAEEKDTLHLGIGEGVLQDPVGVSMGNPHAVFFVKDAASVPLKELGPKLEHHPLFPQRANIGAAQVVSQNHIKLRVFERGAGETLACGTGACAALVAAHRRGLTGRKATVSLPGGDLIIEWLDAGNVLMTGPIRKSFEGTVEL